MEWNQIYHDLLKDILKELRMNNTLLETFVNEVQCSKKDQQQMMAETKNRMMSILGQLGQLGGKNLNIDDLIKESKHGEHPSHTVRR